MTVQTSVQLVGAAAMRDMLRDVPVAMRRRLRVAIRDAGEVVAAEARTRASVWSDRIPGAISVQVRFGGRSAGASVVVDAAAAPHARAYEGLTARGSTFRHPVHGTDKWVSQETRPFLMPAGRAKEREAFELVNIAVTEALRDAGADRG